MKIIDTKLIDDFDFAKINTMTDTLKAINTIPIDALTYDIAPTINKEDDIIDKLTQAGKFLPLWRATSISASGKLIETPNVKSRATMSQARGIRLVYPRRCNA